MRYPYLAAFLGQADDPEVPAKALTHLTKGGLSGLSVTQERGSSPTAAPTEGVPTNCTIGKGTPDPCPACRYTHGSLADLQACTDCGSTMWVVSLVQDDGTARCCAACILRPHGSAGVETPRTSQTATPAAASAAESTRSHE